MNMFIKRRLFSAPCLGHYLAVVIQENKYIKTFIFYIYIHFLALLLPEYGPSLGPKLAAAL